MDPQSDSSDNPWLDPEDRAAILAEAAADGAGPAAPPPEEADEDDDA